MKPAQRATPEPHRADSSIPASESAAQSDKRQRRRDAPRRVGRRGRKRSGADADIEVVGDFIAQIPKGVYKAVGSGARWVRVHGTTKLAVVWKILIPDANAPEGLAYVKLHRWYNVEPLGRGRFRVGAHAAYRRDWILVTRRRPSREDRLSPKVFQGVMAEVEVRTVTTDAHQLPIPEEAQYSVVGRVIRVIVGGGAS